jgi:hypothetical protein
VSSNSIQRRRAPRLKTHLRLQVLGMDEEFHDVDGDISVGGVYIDTDRDVGDLGSVQRLRLASARGPQQLTVLARIARIATINDFWRGHVIVGVAFQFMFHEIAEVGVPLKTVPIESSWAMGEFVRCLARESDEQEARLDHVWQATLESSVGAGRAATVNGVSLQGTVLETDFAVPLGELIRVDIPGSGPEPRIPLFGRALESRAVPESDGKRYRTSVSFESEPTSSAVTSPNSIQEALGALLSATAAAPADEPAVRRQHLAGDLARVSLASVLTVCELERATGVLRLRAAGQEIRCYVSDGRLFDVDRIGADVPQSAESALAPVLAWPSGTFEFLFEPVNRADRIGMPTGALLLTLMHSLDEARRL